MDSAQGAKLELCRKQSFTVLNCSALKYIQKCKRILKLPKIFSFLGFQKSLLLLFVSVILLYLRSLWSLPVTYCSIMHFNVNFS